MSDLTNRRTFLTTSLLVGGAAALWYLRRPRFAAAASTATLPATVTIMQFGQDGKPGATVTIPRVIKTDAEWKKQLSSLAFDVTREEGTERAFSGDSLNVHDAGIFRCVCCNLALFSSAAKFDSGTGWPSFWQPIAKENVLERTDSSFGMERTAVACRLCNAHLGHVFDDGPRPTGLRYCMNSAAMKFQKLA